MPGEYWELEDDYLNEYESMIILASLKFFASHIPDTETLNKQEEECQANG